MTPGLAATVKALSETISLSFEIAAMSLLSILSIASATIALIGLARRDRIEQIYVQFKRALTRSLLLSLELLVVADLIATVAIELTIASVMALGLLIVIRTLLSLSLEVEIDGNWPWRRNAVGRGPDGGSTGEVPR